MLYILVVIYNTPCEESITCQSLMAQSTDDFCVVVYDNSDTDHGIRKECEANGWTYLGGNGNRGLSVAYNSVLNRLKSEKAEGFICILDDDTRLKNTFCSHIISEAGKTNADILLPVMMNNGRILSPWREKGKKYFHSYNECVTEPWENILAFNSGMTISLDALSNYSYDESLFLDCVDISFLDEMKKRGRRIAVVPIYCEHGFSGVEKQRCDAAMNRFNIYIKDMHNYCGEKDIKCNLIILKRAVHLAFLYGTLKPFKIMMKGKQGRK